jgi:hypothetical protein
MSEEHERARALAEVLRDQAERIDTAREAEERRYRRARTRRMVLVGTWLGAAYVWIFSPSWTNIQPAERPPISQEARALRLNLFLETQAIEAYRAERGRLPYVLQEAGPPFRGVEYVRRDSHTYELRGASDRVRLRYFSEEPPLDFVGNAADLLTSGPRGRAGQDR